MSAKLALPYDPAINPVMADPILHPDSDRLRDPVDAPALEALEEGRLSRGFVDQIGDRLDNGDDEAVRALVVPLRPADIAELFAMVAEAAAAGETEATAGAGEDEGEDEDEGDT